VTLLPRLLQRTQFAKASKYIVSGPIAYVAASASLLRLLHLNGQIWQAKMQGLQYASWD
jgi:hypothetical protein